jgi:hypothetical protein
MKNFQIIFKKCWLSLIAGFLWIVYLFKDGFEDSGSEYNMMVCFFLSLGTCVPFGVFVLLREIFRELWVYESFLSAIIFYLFIGLIANLMIRQEWGGGGFLPEPFILEGKVFI